MRRKDKEITDKETIESILKKAEICRIGLCENNQPYIVPMNFGYKAGSLYFHSAKEGRKLDIIKKNPLVCFEVEHNIEIQRAEKPCDWSTKYTSVIGLGKAEFIEEREAIIAAFDIIMEKYTAIPTHQYEENQFKRVQLFKIVISKMTGKKSG